MRRLADGLMLRRATPEDVHRIVALNRAVLGREEEKRGRVVAWTTDLLTRPHPTFRPDDYVFVEETATGRAVSALCTIPQTWSYDGIEFAVGRPELVATLPEYRNCGLIRTQFQLIHEIGAARGEMLQAITGIPFFYRQFGYEYALALGGGKSGYRPNVPELREGEHEPFIVRRATREDVPFILQTYRRGASRSLVACVRTEAGIGYEIEGQSADNLNRSEISVLETPQGRRAGFLAHPTWLWGPTQGLIAFELADGHSWIDVTPSVIRYLWRLGSENAAATGGTFDRFLLSLGSDHPAYTAASGSLPHAEPPYAWYIRVADLPAFLRRIAPALNRRLADSAAAGYTGELKLSFYRSGVRLVWDGACLVRVEDWNPSPEDHGDAGFPHLTFLQLLFGHRSLDELRNGFPDCWASGSGEPLLRALFPKLLSNVWPIA